LLIVLLLEIHGDASKFESIEIVNFHSDKKVSHICILGTWAHPTPLPWCFL